MLFLGFGGSALDLGVLGLAWCCRLHRPCAWHSVQSSNVVVFAERSMHGNGDVMITSCGPWRCLTFDGVEQGVAYVGDGGGTGVLGLEYLRVMAAAALGFGVSCRRLVDKTR